MRSGRTTGGVAAGLVLFSTAAWGQDITLYELTENMRLIGTSASQYRTATAQLMGFADVGTPLCSPALASSAATAELLRSTTKQCTINATGTDTVSLTTGKGTLRGRFTVVVQGDNTVDSPELVVMTGQFKGHMDFSPAILDQVPYGLVTGTFTMDTGQTLPFTGTFRLPFDGDQLVNGQPLRELLCYNGSPPAPFPIGADIKYLDLDAGMPGRCVDVSAEELSLGYATVRFDVRL